MKILRAALSILLVTLILFSARLLIDGAPTETITGQSTRSTVSPAEFSQPLGQALSRLTHKPFGLYVSPRRSPVNPERFTGYHTGVDFETWPDEQDKPVSVFAVCTGHLLQKSWVKGYGGVAVQACTLNGRPITVVYGHLKLSSLAVQSDQRLESGAKLAVLGTGFSTETDGERKHLHLGLHLGSTINLRGYVKTQAELKQWLNAAEYLE
ncbi:MAG: M23 family metallopeptidase [Candidatus Kerfeldbacteria bacterium]|nr:M23 family metallopeptidase [Candidatus Kerfeldbacteria bacterium]